MERTYIPVFVQHVINVLFYELYYNIQITFHDAECNIVLLFYNKTYFVSFSSVRPSVYLIVRLSIDFRSCENGTLSVLVLWQPPIPGECTDSVTNIFHYLES